MINKIYIEGFKSINKLEIECKPFNLLAGTNSSGKSSLIQALLLMAQNLDNHYGLNGPLVAVGEFREIKNYNINLNHILVKIQDDRECVSLSFKEDESPLVNGAGTELAKRISYSSNQIHYLSCNRIGSQDIYKKNRTTNSGVGTNGEYAIDYLCQNKDTPLDDNILKDKSNYTLLAQTNFWLQYIVGANIKAEEVIGTDVVKASYGMIEGRYSRPQNVGSGISYLISIIVMCLGSKAGDFLIIENPEIHLHPLSQSKLCDFLYFISRAERQLIIETHSDHIFNAARVGIATNTMDSNRMALNFFKLGSDNCTRNYVIQIGEYGKIKNPIPNMFDQFEVDLDRMIGV